MTNRIRTVLMISTIGFATFTAAAFGEGTDKATARAAGPVPGALVCPHIKITNKVYQLWVEAAAKKPPAPAPDVAKFGCHVAPANQTIKLEPGMAIAIITITLPDGTSFTGATLPSMIAYR